MFENMRSEDAFWLGYCVGLFEGEGTVNLTRMKSNPDRVYGRLVVRVTDPEPPAVMHRVFGGILAGAHLTPFEAARGYKPKYRWAVSQVDEFLRIARLIQPYLSARRREQIQVGLDTVAPTTRRKVAAGNRRSKTQLPVRPRKTGQLVCPESPEPSARGYQRHRLLGIPVCDICRESFNLYYAARRSWSKEQIRATNHAQWLKRKSRRSGHAISLLGNQPATSPDAAPLSPVGS